MFARLAALDLGSNSFHLHVFAVAPRRPLQLIARNKQKPELGPSVFQTGRIDPAAYERALGAVRNLRDTIAAERPDVVLAVATSALREARNGREFVDEAARLAGFPIRIIDGAEEARLMALGATYGANRSAVAAVFDLGGGSLEVAVTHGARSSFATSLPVGTSRSRRTWRDGPRSRDELCALRRELRVCMRPALERVTRSAFEHGVLSCGSARELARLARESDGAPLAIGGPPVLTRDALCRLRDQLFAVASRGHTCSFADSTRSVDTLLVAATVFLEIMEQLSLGAVEVASGGLREGIAVDYLRRRAALGGARSGVADEHCHAAGSAAFRAGLSVEAS
jgi:exopolyphosphatase/guanosine-5'-triphosphate,3'-diphosphate pyrophosphatase